MQYKYVPDQNFEDLSCGRVIIHKTGYPNYPVRLAVEIFMRCLETIGKLNEEVCIYDPCCGGAYLLTVLGIKCADNIKSIYASDISNDAVSLARENLNLLTCGGLLQRQAQLEHLYETHKKDSYKEAIKSADNLLHYAKSIKKAINVQTFTVDILKKDALEKASFKADIIFTDIPYGNLTSWSKDGQFNVNTLLDNLIPVMTCNSVAAISSDKGQKICNKNFFRVKKILNGKRKIELFVRVF